LAKRASFGSVAPVSQEVTDPVRACPPMLSRSFTATPHGVETRPVEVEVDLAKGLPGFYMVGLPDNAAREGKERIRAAIGHQGFRFPTARISVNLAPAGLPKRGCAVDLSIAAGVLCSSGQLPETSLEGWGLWGELAFDGRLRPRSGALGVASGLEATAEVERLLVPRGCGAQAALHSGLKVYEAADLQEAAGILRAPEEAPACPPSSLPPSPLPDWSEVCGMPFVLEALVVAAAGGHGVLLKGPPGGGKTFLARRLPDLLPDLSLEQVREVATIHSSTGRLPPDALPSVRPPFRYPGPGTTREALVGGGRPVGPGEVTLAHRGVLFLDEAAELPRHVLDSLRTPLVDREVWVNRAHGAYRFPADFQLVLATNPCPCGYEGDSQEICVCSPRSLRRYQERLSGPLLDRIDLQLWVSRHHGQAGGVRADLPVLRESVERARKKQADRWGSGRLNARACLRELRNAVTSRFWRDLSGNLSPRAQEKLLGIALTLADLDGRSSPGEADLERARGLRFRPRTEIAS
jgi:magnesium chelatase family protein